MIQQTMDNYRILIGLGIIGIGIMGAIFAFSLGHISIPTKDYDIFVDPIIDKQNLFITGRVIIQNIGYKEITGVRVDFAQDDVLNIGILKPGKKIIVSPPVDNQMKYVTVSADSGVMISKIYRELPKMVGMMGS